MRIKTQADLTRVINLCIDAVDKSSLGPMITVNPENLNQKTINQVSFSVFTIVLQKIIEKVEFDE